MGLEGIETEDFQAGASRFPKLTYGRHRCKVAKIELKKLFAGGEAYIVEGTVLESSDPISNPVGEMRCLYYQDLKNRKWALQDIGKFVAAVEGFDLVADKDRFDSQLKPHLGTVSTSTYDARQYFTGKDLVISINWNPNDDGSEGYPKPKFFTLAAQSTYVPPPANRPAAPAQAAPAAQAPAPYAGPPPAAPPQQYAPQTTPPAAYAPPPSYGAPPPAAWQPPAPIAAPPPAYGVAPQYAPQASAPSPYAPTPAPAAFAPPAAPPGVDPAQYAAWVAQQQQPGVRR